MHLQEDYSPIPMQSDASIHLPHHANGRFFCPWQQVEPSLLDVLRWKLSKNPYGERGALGVPVVANDGRYLADRSAPDSVTWVGHSTFAVQDGGEVFLTDPHWGPRALLPRRLTPPGVPLAAVPADAFAVLSHAHYDHLDAWTVRRLSASIPWYVPLGLGKWLGRRGKRAVELDWWQSVRHGRWRLTCLPAQHWSNRAFLRRNGTLWCSWLLDSGRRRYFFAGDSGYFSGFAEFGRRFAPVEIAFLPIGAYEPRWFMRPQHVDPEEALQAFLDLGAARMVSMHWGCFDLTDEPPDLAPRLLDEVAAARQSDPKRVWHLAVGERRLLAC